jgi:hypothetical protein
VVGKKVLPRDLLGFEPLQRGFTIYCFFVL